MRAAASASITAISSPPMRSIAGWEDNREAVPHQHARRGARHERHLHRNCDEFFIVLKGHGHVYTDTGEEPSGEGDVVYSPRGCWHGFNNTSDEEVLLVWGWSGAGSLEAAGYEIPAPARR